MGLLMQISVDLIQPVSDLALAFRDQLPNL
jgi:hypothetical protein